MAFNDAKWGANSPQSGWEWYSAQGVRCAAQAVGRVIRHRNDFGAAILLDWRYAAERGGGVRY